MANYTTNYNLKKPLETEKYNVEDQNGNMDILDGEIKRLDDKTDDLMSQTVKLGDNSAINKIKAAELKTDTRTTELVYTDGNITKVFEKDGASTVKTTTLNYDGNGNLISVVENADGVSVTSTLNYNLGQLVSVTKAVV
ncbi:hypothetical protein [Wukongibacter sp. M2B1]|uniref:hypothetical protein n=1 Tax=Wukongibacter sp. M2B1 TaxID=3088895 RepID=UPI003D79622A